jgi:hypothetical protein
MEVEFLIASVITEVEKLFMKEDRDLVHEFLQHDDQGLFVEFICDKIDECHIVIPEHLGKLIQVLSAKFGLNPRSTWRAIVVEEFESHKLRRLEIEDENGLKSVDPQPKTIFEKTKKYLSSEAVSEFNEYLTYGELDLAVETLCYSLIEDKVPISKKDVDTLLTIWLDLDHDPSEWAGFNIQGEK